MSCPIQLRMRINHPVTSINYWLFTSKKTVLAVPGHRFISNENDYDYVLAHLLLLDK